MNIKSEEAHRLARELSAATGESITEAVTVALRERLEREAHEDSVEARVAAIMTLAKRTGPLMRDVPDHDELLYDAETGLPT